MRRERWKKGLEMLVMKKGSHLMWKRKLHYFVYRTINSSILRMLPNSQTVSTTVIVNLETRKEGRLSKMQEAY